MTYDHPDLDLLVKKLRQFGWIETTQAGCDFTRVFSNLGHLLVIDLPETEVYESVEVHFDFKVTPEELHMLGFKS